MTERWTKFVQHLLSANYINVFLSFNSVLSLSYCQDVLKISLKGWAFSFQRLYGGFRKDQKMGKVAMNIMVTSLYTQPVRREPMVLLLLYGRAFSPSYSFSESFFPLILLFHILPSFPVSKWTKIVFCSCPAITNSMYRETPTQEGPVEKQWRKRRKIWKEMSQFRSRRLSTFFLSSRLLQIGWMLFYM